MRIAHTDGKRFDEDSLAYKTLREWIKQGALPTKMPNYQIERLEVFPKERVGPLGFTQQLRVVAHDNDLGAALAFDLEAIIGEHASVEVVPDAGAAISRIRAVDAEGGIVPVAFVQLFRERNWGVDTAISIQGDEIATTTRTVMVTGKPSLLGVDQALQVGAVQGMLTRPWTPRMTLPSRATGATSSIRRRWPRACGA